MRTSFDPDDKKDKKGRFDTKSFVALQVLDNVTLFVDGIQPVPPGNADGSKVHVNDVRQGGIGNCYFHAALYEFAHIHPTLVQSGINRVLGTPADVYKYKVRFYNNSGNTVYETITLDLHRGYNQAYLSRDYDSTIGEVEIWPQVMEAAYAQKHGGYSDIIGGNSSEAWKELTGFPATTHNVNGWSDDAIKQLILNEFYNGNGDKSVIVGTRVKAPDVIDQHAYVIDWQLLSPFQLKNPYGEKHTTLAYDRLSENISNVYILKRSN